MSVLEDPDVAAIARIGAVPTILRVLSQTTGLRLTLVARVTEDSWKACAVHDRMGFGLAPGSLLDVTTTLCSQVRSTLTPVVIDHASDDPAYRHHHTPKLYNLESYIAVPIVLPNGTYFGNVCALDSRPAKLKESEALATMQLYAELIALQLEAEQRAESTRVALLDERETAELREQFIAVLGHDMRTPLGAITAGTALLRGRGLPASEERIVSRIQNSTARIARLVDDLMDFARGRLGGGIPLRVTIIDDLVATFSQVVHEARATHPGRRVELDAPPCGLVQGDPDRLAQLLSNLLVNALQHGTPDAPVKVSLRRHGNALTIAVHNDGAAIALATQAQLFQPFFRGKSSEHGLGLGLYIVSQIVKSHGGTIEVRSSEGDGTTFVCTLPATR